MKDLTVPVRKSKTYEHYERQFRFYEDLIAEENSSGDFDDSDDLGWGDDDDTGGFGDDDPFASSDDDDGWGSSDDSFGSDTSSNDDLWGSSSSSDSSSSYDWHNPYAEPEPAWKKVANDYLAAPIRLLRDEYNSIKTRKKSDWVPYFQTLSKVSLALALASGLGLLLKKQVFILPLFEAFVVSLSTMLLAITASKSAWFIDEVVDPQEIEDASDGDSFVSDFGDEDDDSFGSDFDEDDSFGSDSDDDSFGSDFDEDDAFGSDFDDEDDDSFGSDFEDDEWEDGTSDAFAQGGTLHADVQRISKKSSNNPCTLSPHFLTSKHTANDFRGMLMEGFRRNRNHYLPENANREDILKMMNPYIFGSTPDFAEWKDINIRSTVADNLCYLLYQGLNDIFEVASDPGENPIIICNSICENVLMYKVELDFNRLTIKKPKPGQLDKNLHRMRSPFRTDTEDNSVEIIATQTPTSGVFVFKILKTDNKFITISDALQYYNEESGESTYKNYVKESKFLPFCLGLQNNEKPFITDIADETNIAVFGTSGGGKGWFVYSLLYNLCISNSPRDAAFIILDKKKAPIFKNLAMLPHCLGHFSDTSQFMDILREVEAEMDYRKQWTDQLEAENWKSLRTMIKQRNPDDLKYFPWLFVVFDEMGATLGEFKDLDKKYHDEFVLMMGRIAMQCRALGIKLVGIAQRPIQNEFPKSLLNNCSMKVSFKVQLTDLERNDMKVPEGVDAPSRPGQAIVESFSISNSIYVRTFPMMGMVESPAVTDNQIINLIRMMSFEWALRKPTFPIFKNFKIADRRDLNRADLATDLKEKKFFIEDKFSADSLNAVFQKMKEEHLGEAPSPASRASASQGSSSVPSQKKGATSPKITAAPTKAVVRTEPVISHDLPEDIDSAMDDIFGASSDFEDDNDFDNDYDFGDDNDFGDDFDNDFDNDFGEDEFDNDFGDGADEFSDGIPDGELTFDDSYDLDLDIEEDEDDTIENFDVEALIKRKAESREKPLAFGPKPKQPPKGASVSVSSPPSQSPKKGGTSNPLTFKPEAPRTAARRSIPTFIRAYSQRAGLTTPKVPKVVLEKYYSREEIVKSYEDLEIRVLSNDPEHYHAL